jgi:integrase
VRAYFLLRYSGQRRSDVVKMRRSQYDGTAIEVVQQKTGTYCWIPAHARLREHLSTTGIEGEYLLSSTRGGPFRATSLTTMICNVCTELGFPGHSPHGLRHLAGAALAESGCTMDEIMSVLGHLTEDECRIYVQQARRKVLAKSAMKKWEANG